MRWVSCFVFAGRQIGVEGAHELAKVLKSTNTFVSINLHCAFQSRSIDYISIDDCSFAANEIGPDGARIIVESLKGSPTLKTLGLTCALQTF